ncbi:MAG: DUF302 domain-containing protein [Gammaproteobacteria bacterium]
MKKQLLIVAALTALFTTNAMAQHVDGMIKMKSKYSVSETIDRLANIVKKKGITVALRWNHSAKANKIGIPMRPTELLVFGNPKLGSYMMTAEQTAAIDMPLKAIAWKDAKGQVWLGYNSPQYIAKRHHIKDRAKVIKKISHALATMTHMAAGIK